MFGSNSAAFCCSRSVQQLQSSFGLSRRVFTGSSPFVQRLQSESASTTIGCCSKWIAVVRHWIVCRNNRSAGWIKVLHLILRHPNNGSCWTALNYGICIYSLYIYIYISVYHCIIVVILLLKQYNCSPLHKYTVTCVKWVLNTCAWSSFSQHKNMKCMDLKLCNSCNYYLINKSVKDRKYQKVNAVMYC